MGVPALQLRPGRIIPAVGRWTLPRARLRPGSLSSCFPPNARGLRLTCARFTQRTAFSLNDGQPCSLPTKSLIARSAPLTEHALLPSAAARALRRPLRVERSILPPASPTSTHSQMPRVPASIGSNTPSGRRESGHSYVICIHTFAVRQTVSYVCRSNSRF